MTPFVSADEPTALTAPLIMLSRHENDFADTLLTDGTGDAFSSSVSLANALVDVGSNKTTRVEAVEALAHPCFPARRLYEMAATWPDSLKDLKPRPASACRTTPKPLDESVVEDLVKTYQSGGVSANSLAKQFGIHRHTVAKHLRDHGIDTVEPKLTRDEIQEAADLYCQGWSLARLGKKFGVDDGTVRSRLLEIGVAMRARRGGKPGKNA